MPGFLGEFISKGKPCAANLSLAKGKEKILFEGIGRPATDLGGRPQKTRGKKSFQKKGQPKSPRGGTINERRTCFEKLMKTRKDSLFRRKERKQ